MSLISFKNFLAPFYSKVQIGALLVLAFLAFVLRIGAQTDTPSPGASSRQTLSAGEQEDPLANSLKAMMAEQQKRLAVAPKKAPGADPTLDDLVAGKGLESPQPPPSSGSGAASPRPLGDVRRSLGLD